MGQNRLFVIGAGPGAAKQITSAATAVLREVDCVLVAPRYLPLVEGHKNIIVLKNFNMALDQLEHELSKGDAAVLVSGDPGIYSLLPLLKHRFCNTSLYVLPGISSLQFLCAEVAETWADAVILSGHGRELSTSRLLNAIERNRLVIIFCDAEHSPLWICESLINAVGGLAERVEVIIGERLSAPNQRVTRGRPKELAGLTGHTDDIKPEFDVLSLVLVRNERPWTPPISRPKDEDFERGNVPMTRCEVRSVVLDRLELTPDAVVWDIGAGTGSISVAVALAESEVNGTVHAVEFEPAALELLERNRAKFHLHNMTIHAGRALAVLDNLPRPTHVFIGGSGGELESLLAHIASLGGNIRVVISAVTLDTLSTSVQLLSSESWQNFEAVQIAVSRSRSLEHSILMAAQNPVTLLSAVTRGENILY